eukprot:TRINITY_DN404_c0_g1_i2.p1 TRINITY_DN404_c0_g1~~TRINITY_DN404_c0_g1_i2.p1  ORF type:complete len:133 (+),score=24.37 TRINITY_DN404_c0_g1_i2:88-486(+)
MRNRGPGQWREWRWGTYTVPLYMPNPKETPPEGQKPLNEIAHLTIRAMIDKNALPTLQDAITALVAEPDEPMPDGRISEERLRDLFKDTAASILNEEEMDAIWPAPVAEVPAEAREPSKRRGSKVTKKGDDG